MTEAEMLEAISDFRIEFADVAEVEERPLTERLRAIFFRPTNPDAASAVLLVGMSDVVLETGKGGRFELDLDDEPLEILRAVAAGRVKETTNLLGTTCHVFLADGTERKSTRAFNWTLLGGPTRRYEAWRSSKD